MRNILRRAGAPAACALCLLVSCQQFFTTSLAATLARDSYAIPADMSVEDATALLDEAIANGDVEMAAALVTPLLAALEAATPGSDAYEAAATALLDAAVLSSGVGPALNEALSVIPLDDLSGITEEAMSDMVTALSTIALDDSAEDALVLLAADPPESLEADQAYAAAIALAMDAFGDAGLDPADMGSLSAEQEAALSADPGMAAAIDLLDLAATLGGGESIVGGLLSGIDLSAFE